jgi:hypothetical protein
MALLSILYSPVPGVILLNNQKEQTTAGKSSKGKVFLSDLHLHAQEHLDFVIADISKESSQTHSQTGNLSRYTESR